MKPVTVVMLLGLFVLTGCGGMKASDFAGTEPKFLIEEYFEGETHAWGIFEDRFGNLKRQFFVKIIGTRDGDTIVLDEFFDYSDGEKERRIWTITKTGPNTYEGTAGDVVGKARGEAYGNALNWAYDLNLKVGDGTIKLHFDDWMFLQPNGVLINRARVTKWGFKVGEVTLAFTKPGVTAVDVSDLVRPSQAEDVFGKAANQ